MVLPAKALNHSMPLCNVQFADFTGLHAQRIQIQIGVRQEAALKRMFHLSFG